MGFLSHFRLWPSLLEALEAGLLCHADVAVGRCLLGGVAVAEEPAAAVIALLSAAARQGHLCLSCGGEEVKDLLPQGPIAERLEALFQTGIILMPSHLLGTGKPLYRWHDSLYLHKYWHAETSIVTAWRRLEALAPTVEIDTLCYEALLHYHQHQGRLSLEQYEAVRGVATATLSLLAGGPGTGKTHTAGFLLQALQGAVEEGRRGSFRIGVAAPTGKAAAQLHRSLGHAYAAACGGGEAVAPPLTLTPMTLHALLGLGHGRRRHPMAPKLSYDLLVVDESSMIDALLMHDLLAALKPGARLLLIGDPWQLPPVDAGGPFADILAYRRADGDVRRRPAELTSCQRSELHGIVTTAELIRRGDSEG